MPPDEAYRKAQQWIVNAQQNNAPNLDLSRLGLTTVPKELGQLAKLTILTVTTGRMASF